MELAMSATDTVIELAFASTGRSRPLLQPGRWAERSSSPLSARFRTVLYVYELPGAHPHRSGHPQWQANHAWHEAVQVILEYLASGMSREEVLADFPDLFSEDIRAALLFAADRGRRLFSASLVKLLFDENLSFRQC